MQKMNQRRLVAKRYNQEHGIDYYVKFKVQTLRTILAFAVNTDFIPS